MISSRKHASKQSDAHQQPGALSWRRPRATARSCSSASGCAFESRRRGRRAPAAGEAPADTALRLAGLKAQSVRQAHRDALIIGSDQVATSGGRLLGKPGDHATAVRQLRSLSGKSADFHTALALLDAGNGKVQTQVVPCRVHFRKLDDELIERYLNKEKPYDCAGSAKVEGLGIALIASIDTEDPTSLIGLPLIALTAMLERAGVQVI
jgi:septum formation protein